MRRRELLAAGAAAGTSFLLGERWARAQADGPATREIDFAALGDGDGWADDWTCPGVANVRRSRGEGLLEAGSDVFPNDPRPVVFAVDARFRDGTVSAVIARPGAGAGVVVRRASPRAYYAAIYEPEQPSLVIVRRLGSSLVVLARAVAPTVSLPATLTMTADGARPTRLTATLAGDGGPAYTAAAVDSSGRLASAGDPGVLATAQTLFPSQRNPVLPALGNLHLLPYGVQEGQAFLATPVGGAVVGEIRRRSTAAFRRISIVSDAPLSGTVPSVIAATTGAPTTSGSGAHLHVALDLPAAVSIEIAGSPSFRGSRTLRVGGTRDHEAVERAVSRLRPGRRVFWRPVIRRAGTRSTGPVRSFRVLPSRGSGEAVTIAVGSCGAQFGPIFDRLAERRPDVFVWQGDLNYPDTHGPLAQTTGGYAGIWRDFLANPQLLPVLERSAFAAQRDDHDYGIQDANSTNLPPWALGPWDALMGRRRYYRFAAGLAEVWVLNQREFKSDPALADGPGKTLLGERQRRWLFRTLAASRAPFKVVCSPCTLLMPGNARDGSWAGGFGAERDLLLRHVSERVGGRTVFVTGDTHLTGVYDHDGLFEARAAPIGIPTPNDITLVDPLAAERLRATTGVSYAGHECHFACLEVRGDGTTARLDLSLVREDGAVPFSRRFAVPLPG